MEEVTQDVRRERAIESVLNHESYVSLQNIDELRARHSRELSQEAMSMNDVTLLRFDIEDLVFGVGNNMDWHFDAITKFHQEVNKLDPALRFNATVHIVRNAGLMKQEEDNSDLVRLRQVLNGISASSLPRFVPIDYSFSGLPRSPDGFLSGYDMSNTLARSASTPAMRRNVAAIKPDVWGMLREIDSGYVVRDFLQRVPEYLTPASPQVLLPEQARKNVGRHGPVHLHPDARQTFQRI